MQNSRFKIGWVLLLSAAGLMALNHFVLIFALDEPTLFIGYTAFSVYALAVLAIPFRHRERWAWYCTWVLAIGLAIPAYLNPDIAVFYAVFAALCTLGLLLTKQEFFPLSAHAGSKGHDA
jgi:hypothetical protein